MSLPAIENWNSMTAFDVNFGPRPLVLRWASAMLWRIEHAFERARAEGRAEDAKLRIFFVSVIFAAAFLTLGVGATREPDHICELFVEGDCHRRGIGRLLFEAMSQGRAQMTVHASPFGLPFYHRLGFRATGPEQTVDGLQFTPMVWQRMLEG
jgi:GNAT superfamily N-acetyltransferase